MFGYLAILSRMPGALTDSKMEQLMRVATSGFGHGLSANFWLSADRRIAVMAWAQEAPSLPALNRFHFFHGYVREGTRRWSDDEIAAFNKAHPEADLDVLPLGGVFCMNTVTQKAITVQTPISNLYHCHLAKNDHLTVLASKAQVAHLVVNDGRANVSPGNLTSLVACRWMPHLRTAYADVEMLPANARITVTPNEHRIESIGDLLFDGEPAPLCSSLIDEAAHELLNAHAAVHTGNALRIGVTGGRDSRLMLATVHRLGLVGSTFTIGTPTHPDVVIGARVAQVLGIKHEIANPMEGAMPNLSGLRRGCARTLFSSDLNRDAWNPTFSGRLCGAGEHWSGYGGELLRGGFLKGKPQTGADHDTVAGQFTHYFLRFDDILTDEAAAAYRDQIESDYLERLRSMRYPGALLDECYLRARCGVWAAASQIRFDPPRIVPLCDNRLLRLIYTKTNTAQRANDALVKALTAAIAPQLAGVPTLSEEKLAPTITVTRNLDMKQGGFWKYAAPTILDNEFRSVILAEESDRGGLWSIVSFERVANLYRSGEIYSNARIRQLWSVYSLALICSGAWAEPESVPDIEASTDAQAYQVNWAKLRHSIRRKVNGRSYGSLMSRVIVRKVLLDAEVPAKTSLSPLGIRLGWLFVKDALSKRRLSAHELATRMAPKPLERVIQAV